MKKLKKLGESTYFLDIKVFQLSNILQRRKRLVETSIILLLKTGQEKLGARSCRAPAMHLNEHRGKRNSVYLKYSYPHICYLHYKFRSLKVSDKQ